MAKTHGVTCDLCGRFVVTASAEVQPDGWIRVILPHSDRNRREDSERDLCSDRCMEKLGKERRLASSDGSSRNRRSRMDVDLANFLDVQGVPRSGRGALARMHANDGHDRVPKPGCLICEFATGEKEDA